MAYRKTSRVQDQLADKRTRILDAARRMVSRDGFRGTGMDEVAAAAGIAVGTVYRYFPSKAALFVEVVSRVSESEVAAVADVGAEAGPAAQRLDRAVRTFSDRALANHRLAHALIVEPTDPAVEDARLRYRRLLADVFARIIADGIAGGEFPEQDASVSGVCVAGALMEALVGPLARQDRSARPVASIAAFCARAVSGGASR